MPLETAGKAGQVGAVRSLQSGVTVDKADTAVVAPSDARSFRSFVGRFLLPMSPVLPSLKSYILLTPVVFAVRFQTKAEFCPAGGLATGVVP